MANRLVCANVMTFSLSLTPNDNFSSSTGKVNTAANVNFLF